MCRRGGKAGGGGDGRRREDGLEKVKEGLDSGDGIRDVGVENVAMLTEVRVGADGMEMMQGAREGRDMSERAKWTGGEGRRDMIGAVGAMGEKEVVVFFVVFGGNMEETSVTEGSKVMKELGTGRVFERVVRIMEVRVVLCDPARREKAMFGGNMVGEGGSKVCGGVRRDRVVEVEICILEGEERGMGKMGSVGGMEGSGDSGRRGGEKMGAEEIRP